MAAQIEICVIGAGTSNIESTTLSQINDKFKDTRMVLVIPAYIMLTYLKVMVLLVDLSVLGVSATLM